MVVAGRANHVVIVGVAGGAVPHSQRAAKFVPTAVNLIGGEQDMACTVYADVARASRQIKQDRRVGKGERSAPLARPERTCEAVNSTSLSLSRDRS